MMSEGKRKRAWRSPDLPLATYPNTGDALCFEKILFDDGLRREFARS
jgi:hypothetical protein